jgi:hypothetical protein
LATSSNIYKIDAADGNQLGQFRYSHIIESVSGLAWGDGKLWMAGPFADKAYEIDTDRAILDGYLDSSITNQVIFTNPLSFRGIMHFEDGLFILSWTNSETATVYEYDPVSGNMRQQFNIIEFNQEQHNPIQGGLANDGTYFYTGGDNFRILKLRY